MQRIESVDVFRLVAITAVIAIHSTPFEHKAINTNETYNLFYYLINQLARFAVPFFFVISGYFFGQKIKQGHVPLNIANKLAKKIIIIFLAWSFIYLLPYNITSIIDLGYSGPFKVAYWHINDLIKRPALIILEGTKVHLWFLIGLLSSLYLVTLMLNNKIILLTVSLSLYIIGVLAKSYSTTEVGIEFNFNTRNGPFFSTLLFTTGYFFSKKSPRSNWAKSGLVVFTSGVGVHLVESYFLWAIYGVEPTHDYLFGTYFMGVGVSIIALSNHRYFRSQSLSALGKVTLGIYASHFIFIDLFNRWDEYYFNVIWEIGYVFIVLICSTILTLGLSKISKVKHIVC